MKKRYRRKRYSRRRRSLNASKWWPIVKLLLFIVGGLLAAALLTLIVMVVLETVFHIDTPLRPDGLIAKLTQSVTKEDTPFVVSPSPYVSPEPTPTPHPMTEFNAKDEEREVVIPPEFQYYWFGDPYFHKNKMLFSAGKVIGDNVKMCALLVYDPEKGRVVELSVKPENSHFIYPVFNDEWLVYLDGNKNGGGKVCACRIKSFDEEFNLETPIVLDDPIVIKTVYTGQPELRLDGHYVSWIERTGTSRDKLFVCDLETQETTVIAMFNSSSYGTSAPYMKDGVLIWASEGTQRFEDGRRTSVIKYIDVNSSSIMDLNVDTYVHDPEFNGEYFAWIDAHHSENSSLYIARLVGDQLVDVQAIAEGVVDFVLDDHYVAYSIDEAVFVYLFRSGESFRITPETELCQLLGGSEGRVIWMDVTTRERDVMKYAKIPTV